MTAQVAAATCWVADDVVNAEGQWASPLPLAVSSPGAAQIVGISDRQWGWLDEAELVPEPVRIGQCKRWVIDGPGGLRAWLAAGCPARARWKR